EKRARSGDIERASSIVTQMVAAMMTKRAGMSYFALLTLCFWTSLCECMYMHSGQRWNIYVYIHTVSEPLKKNMWNHRDV
ncbi:MAG: hypothetical protein VXW88_04730, partial [Pseudomonadota bacterium]|nr:hypothetical protein [Pseudomonadota bacterium]